jgi:hypothetical protein
LPKKSPGFGGRAPEEYGPFVPLAKEDVQTAIEYEYRCTEYRSAEHEYEEFQSDARTYVSPTVIPEEPE